MQSKSVNNVCKLLQSHTAGLHPWTPLGNFRPLDLLSYSPQINILGTVSVDYMVYSPFLLSPLFNVVFG